jgi:hypothetical protein
MFNEQYEGMVHDNEQDVKWLSCSCINATVILRI